MEKLVFKKTFSGDTWVANTATRYWKIEKTFPEGFWRVTVDFEGIKEAEDIGTFRGIEKAKAAARRAQQFIKLRPQEKLGLQRERLSLQRTRSFTRALRNPRARRRRR